LGAYQTYANANIGTLYLGNISINSNLGAYQTYANANAATQATSINTINANLGAYQTYANANAVTQATSIDSINANLGAYQTYANANIGTLFNGNATTNANLGAFQTYANATFITTAGTYSNANVASYLPTYAGNIGNAAINSGIRYIHSGNAAYIWANSTTASGGYIQLATGNSTISPAVQTATGLIQIASRTVSITGNLDHNLGGVNINGNTFMVGDISGSYNGNLVSILLANTLISSQGTSLTAASNYGGYLFVTNTTTTGNLITSNGVFWSNGVAYGSVGASQSPWTGNIAGAGYYLSNAILATTREKQANLGVIQGTVAIDANTGPIQSAVVTANITINTNNLSNFATGQTVTLVLTQNTNANLRILTSNLKYAGGSKVLSNANAAIDTVTVMYDGTNYLAALVKGYT
jgi:hypothetical protein